jgi:signal transduction histidine kinase
VVRATTEPGTVRIAVVDQGRGFDPAAVTPGIGLTQSILGRLRSIGGQAYVTSQPGAGTAVELSAPVGR